MALIDTGRGIMRNHKAVQPTPWLAAAVLLLVLPWLMPYAPGPSPATVPWLFSWACAATFIGLQTLPDGRPERPDGLAAITAIAWLLAAALSALIALVQYFGFSDDFRPWINQTPMGDAFANLRQRNQFATLTNIGLVSVLWAGRTACWRKYLRAIPRAPWHGLRRFWPFVLVALLAFGNAASSSRTGLVQLAAILCIATVYGWLHHRPTRSLVLFAIAVYGVAVLLLPVLAGLDPLAQSMLARLTETGDTCQSRLLLWRNVVYLIAQKPWSGWGWGELDFAHFTTVYPDGRFCDILDNAHNLPLHLAVELGVPVALLVCGLIGWVVLRASPWRETDDNRCMAWAVLALIGLHSLLEYPLWYGPFQIAVVLSVWILWCTPARIAGVRQGVTLPGVKVPAPNPVWAGTCAVAVLSALAYAAWDYHRVSQIYRSPALRAPAYRANTLAKVQDSWLFRNQVRFAALTLTAVTPDNAATINRSAHDLLHFSPEARVVQKLIDSALVLGHTDEAVFYMRRMRSAYPKAYAHWRETREPVAGLPAIDP